MTCTLMLKIYLVLITPSPPLVPTLIFWFFPLLLDWMTSLYPFSPWMLIFTTVVYHGFNYFLPKYFSWATDPFKTTYCISILVWMHQKCLMLQHIQMWKFLYFPLNCLEASSSTLKKLEHLAFSVICSFHCHCTNLGLIFSLLRSQIKLEKILL